MEKQAKTAILYHDDLDGFGAAFAYWYWQGRYNTEEALYIPVQYGEAFPCLPETVEKVYVLDFSYSRDITLQKQKKFKIFLTIDHHKIAQKELEGLNQVVFDMKKSGCMLAWRYFGPDTLNTVDPVTYEGRLMKHIQDRDLWQFKLANTEEINLALEVEPRDLEHWSNLCIENLILKGRAIKAFRDVQIKRAVDSVVLTTVDTKMGTFQVPIVNTSVNISEVGQTLYEKFPEAPFVIMYHDKGDLRIYSLRSKGDFDVSEFARRYGGGGHKNAAGFIQKIGKPIF